MRSKIDAPIDKLGRGVLLVTSVTALAAWGGAFGLMAGRLDLTRPVEQRLPLRSPVIGGLGLALVVAVPCTFAAWRTWRRHPRAATAVEIAGWLLVAWIVVEIAFIRTFSPLQPICGAIGVLLIVLGRRAR